ncbi:MAG: TIGR04255 family protein, partial [Chitinophagaceae bacterium]
TYTNRPLKQLPFRQGLPAKLGQEITIKVGNPSLFYNDKISIQLSENSLVFTSLIDYIGWKDYKPEIEKALSQLMATTNIKKCTRVGLRYISEYPNQDLKDCINFKFSFGLPQFESETTAFRSEFMYNDTKVILNLNNKVPFIKQELNTKQTEIVRTSIIDIDVISENLELDNLNDLLNTIEINHTKEKEVYFSMLKDEYLQSLNPVY